MEMFSFRITKTEFSQHSPIKGYDVCYSDFRGCEIYKVPILSIYGTTPAGQKGCLHVHGVFPYMCLRWSDVFPEISEVNSRKYLQELALEIDKALNTDAGRSNSSRHHVHNIIITKGKLIYGFHQSDEDFLKIYFYNPNDVSRTIDLLTKSKVLKKSIQPCYAHIPFRLQFYTDYNLGYGVIVNVSSYQFRALRETCNALHADSAISLPDSNNSSHKVWNISTLTSSQVSDIPRETDQELELDCHETSILNKKDSLLCVGKNPGIAAIWDEERERRRLEQNSSQFTPPSTIERVVVESDSEIHFKSLFNKRCESDVFKQFEKNGEIGYIKDSQNSFTHLSSESFTFSNTQEKELLEMCISMYANQGPDDDSILAAKNDFISDDDDEVTLEMSQQFTDEILSDIHPNYHSESKTSDNGKSLNQRQHLIPQLDGAFDDEKYGTKQDKKSENTDNDEPPILNLVHPHSNHRNRNIQSSAEATTVKNSKAAEEIPIPELRDNLESISDKMKKNVSKKLSLLSMNQDDKRQMKKLNTSVTKCVESIIARVDKMLNEKSESHSFGSKECGTNNTSNLFVQSCPNPYENKTKPRKEECFIGARPKTTKNIPSISSRMSKSIQKKKNTLSEGPPDLSGTPNLSSVSESPVIKLNLSDSARTVEQVNTSSNFKAHIPAISTNSPKHALKNKRTNLHPNLVKEDFLNVSCSTKALRNSDSVPDKNIINPTNKKFPSSTSNSIKISSSNHRKPPLTVDKFIGTEPLDDKKKDCFNIVTDLKNFNFSKVGHEVVLVKKLTEEEINAATLGCHKISLKSDRTENLNSKSCNKTNHQKNVKNSHKNKGKSSDPYKMKNLKGQLPVIKSNNAQKLNECVSSMKKAISNTNIKNSKCVAVNDNFSSPEKISLSKKNRSHNVNSKNSDITSLETNMTYNLNQKVLEVSSVKEGTFNNNKIKTSNVPHFGVGFNGSGEMIKNLEPKALFSGTIINSYDSLINVKEAHSDFKNSSDHHNQENVTNSFISKPINSAGSCSLSYSKNKGNMKDKNVSESRKKKLESACHLNKKHIEQDAAEIHENFDVDSKKDIEETFKHSLQERNILYYPQPKTADAELLTKSHTKTFRNESNLLVDNIKVKCDSSLHQVDESAKLKQFYDNIVRNSPFVFLTDCLRSGEGQTRHDRRKKYLASKKTVSRPYRYPSVSIKSEQKESNILSEAKRNISITYSRNSDIKAPKNVTKPKESQIPSALYNFCCKMQRASCDAINSKEIPTCTFEKNNPVNTSPFSVKPKINSELEVYSSSNAASDDCQNTGCSAIGPKPSIKSKYLDDINANNLLRNEAKARNTLPSHYDNNSYNKNLSINSAILESVSIESVRDNINEDNSKPNLIFPLVSYNTLDKNKNRDKQKNCSEVVLKDLKEGIINGRASKKNIKSKPKEFSMPKDSRVPVIPKSIKNPNSKVNRSDNSFLEKLKTEISKRNLKHTKEVNNVPTENSKTSDENIGHFVHSHPSIMKTATVKDNSKSYCGYTGIEKIPEAKSVNVSNSESKQNSTEPWNNNDAPSYLYDIVKLRNASKQNSSNASKISNNYNSSIASKGKPKKNAFSNKSENAKSSGDKLNANSANQSQSAFETEKLASASKTKKYVPTSESEKTAAASIAKNCRSKSEYEFCSKNTLLKKNSDHADKKDHSEIKLCEEPISDKTNQFTAISKSNTSSLIKEKMQSSLTSSKNHNDISKNTLLYPARGRPAKKSGSSNNFGFFSSKIPQRRCQNDIETSQIPKPTSSKLSLKLNKKGANVNAKRESTTLVDFKTKWKIDNLPYDNQSERSASTETVANQQVSEAVAFVPNIRIKKEPPDDYEVLQDNNMKDALSCFDFEENSSSDATSYLSSSSKHSRNSKDQTVEMSSKERDILPRNGKNKYKKNSKYENAPLVSKPNRSRKSLVEITHSDIIKENDVSFDSDTSTSQNNNTSSNNRYPKRSCSFSSSVEDEVVILEDIPSSSAKSLKSRARSSRCVVSEIIDLEKEEDSIDRSSVITIKRDSDGNNSIIPNKRRFSDSEHNLNSVNILESQTPSMSSSNNITDSCSKNLDDSPDSKQSLKLTLKLKTILTRSNEPKFVVIDRQLQGHNKDEIDSSDIIDIKHIKKEPGTESPKRKHSKIKQNYQQTSTRPNLFEPIVPPILIKDIKKEKDDDYEKKPYVAPLKVNLSTLNVTKVERPNTNTGPKLEPLRLCRKSNKFYVGTGSTANNELPENNDDNFNNRNSTPPKRKRGRPAKVQKSSSPQKDISPLKSNTSFDGNSNGGCLTFQIPKKPASEQSFDIDKKCSFKQSCKKGQSDTDKNSAVKWWWEVGVKEEPKSDTEDPCSSNGASCSQKNEIIPISKRRNSLRCESFKKFFDSDHSDDDDTKPKTIEVKPQKKRKRSKSVNCEGNKKIFIEAKEISSAPNRRTSARKGSFKKYYDSDKGENSSDDCKVVCIKKVEKPRKPGHRKKKRQYTTKNKQRTSSDILTLPCNPCSVTLERLSPSLLEQNVAAKTAQNIFQPGRRKSVECTISQNNDIKKIPESNSVIPESQHIAQMNDPESILSVPGAIEHISTEQFSSNVEKSSFKTMDKKVAHAFSTSVENTGTKFILDSGPVTINGLNSINMDNSLSEFLCDEMISENKMNCSPFMYNSPPLSADSNMISNSNSGNFLRRTSHERDQCLFESPSSILKNGSMDSQSPLLYSQSPVTDVKQVSDLSPDNRYLHLSPQAFKQQTNLMHSSIFNSETIFENSPLENFEMSSNSIRESLRTTDRDFNKGRQQRGMNTYATASESHNESRRSIPSMISNSIDKSNMHVNISKDMHNPLQLHSKDFDRGHQHNSSYTLRNSPMDQNTEFLTYNAKGIVNLDKTPSEPHDSLKTPDSSLKRRKNDISCFSSAYSELRRPSKQVRHEESNTEKDHSCFSNSYNASAEVRQSPTSYSTPNQSGYNNAICSMIHSRSEKPLNTLKSHNEYFARMKWDNPHHSSKNNGSFSEDNKSQMNHFPVQQNRYVGYYPKPNDSDPNAKSRTSNEPYYRSNWPDVNTHFPHNDRSLYGFSPNDGSFNDFSLNERSTVEAFKKSPIQQEFKKYDGNFCKISNQMPSSLSASNEEFHAPKSTDVNFSHFSDYDCNPKKSQPSNDKNPFNKNMEVFFRQPGFSSNSPNTMSPSAIPCSSPMGISKSPLQPEARVAFKKESTNSPESSGTGSKYIDICEQSPANSFSDHMETVLSPIISNSSSVQLSSRSLNNVEEYRNEVKSPLIGELSSDYPKDANDVKTYIGDFNPNSANSSREIITILSESDDAMSEYDLNIKSSDISSGARQNDSETPINDKDIVFRETLNLIEDNTSFDLLSEEIVSEDESFLTAYNVFSNSPQNKVSDDTPIPSNRANNTVKSSLSIISTLSSANQNTVPDLTPSTYDGSFDWKILGLQEHADDNNSELRPLSGGFETNCMSSFLSQDNNDGDKGNDNESAKSELQTCHENSIQLISDMQNNNCPLFVEAVPNMNVIVTNTSEMDSTNAILPLESFKNAVLPVVSANNSVKSDALCFTQPSTSATYDSVNPAFLSTWMVNDSSLVLPQSNFFFNNASIIISDNSAEEESLNFFQNPETLENSSTNNISEENSKDTQKMQSLKKSFNSGDDILSMIVKSCDIGEEFDENFSPSKENMDDVDAAELDNPSEKIEKASFLGLANGTNLYTINNSDLCSPRNISSCVVSPINEGESVVHTSELYHQISENHSTEKINSSSSLQQGNQTKSNQCLESCQSSMHHSHVCSPRNISPGAVSPENQAESVHASELSHQISESQSTGINSSASLLQGNQTWSSQCLESCQDRSSIQDSAPLDSMVQSFYSEDTLYDLNSSTNCDILSYHCSSQYCDVPSIPKFKNFSKLFHDINVDDNIKMEKVVSIISPNQSIDLPSNGNLLLIVKSRPISNKFTKFHHVSVDKNNQLKIKEIFSSDKISKKKSKYDTVVICPGNVPPLYIRLLFGFMKSLHNYKTDSSPKGPYNIKIEYTDVDNGFETNSPCDKPLVLCRTLCSELLAMDKTLVGTPSLKKLSPSVNLESTPSAHRPLMQKIQLKELNVSPISKDILLTRCTKKKRKLSFSGGMECSGMLEGKNKEKYRKISVEEDKLKELQANATSSDIDGPTLENSRGFRVNIEDCGRIQHEAQHLTIMSLEIHVNTRNSLNPDPKNDPVSVIFYSIYNESETYQQEIVGVIAVDSSQKDCSLKGSHAFKTNFLNLLPGVKTSQVFIVEDEKAAFEKLVCVVKEWDPDILIGFEIQMLSWGYLIERANFLSMNLPSMLSRLLTKKEEPKFEHVQEDNTVTDQTADIDRINIPGRIVLNLWRLLRKEITLNVYSFENVCYHVLHRRIPCYTPMKLTEWFLGRHKEIIVRFYVSRVLGSIQILEKLDTIRRTGEMARLYGIDFYEVLSRGSQFRVESMMLRTAAPMRYFPVSPSVQQRSHSRAPECVPLIMEPESKFYQDPVVVLDFQSLYPSIMIAYNYCFSTCLGRLEHLGKDGPFEFGCTSLSIPPSLLRKLALEDNIHFSPQGVAFVRSRVRRGVLPVMLEEILNARIMVKQSLKKIKNNNALKKLLDARQLGLKLISNVTYGYTGASFSGRMPCVEVADSIVGKARETLERAIKLIENTPEWRASVIYGDTDSLFIYLPGRSLEEAFKLGYEIAETVTRTNPEPVKLKFEKVYLPCVLQTKKRYCGFMYETPDQKSPIFDAKGIETVRRDSCPATAKILEKSLKILFQTQDVDAVKFYVQKQFTKILKGRVSIIDFVFAKEYRGMSGYRPGACVPALEIAKKRLAKDPRAEPRSGERVPYVIVYGFPGMPIIRLVHEPADLLRDPSLRINATYYITRVISPPLERIFSLLGANVKSWYSELTHIHRLNLPMINHTKETITQYFTSRRCPSCKGSTYSPLCIACQKDWVGTVADLQIKIRDWERTPDNLKQICVSCTKSNESVNHCSSMDCPVLFKLYLANIDLAQAPYLRKILTREIRELF